MDPFPLSLSLCQLGVLISAFSTSLEFLGREFFFFSKGATAEISSWVGTSTHPEQQLKKQGRREGPFKAEISAGGAEIGTVLEYMETLLPHKGRAKRPIMS